MSQIYTTIYSLPFFTLSEDDQICMMTGFGNSLTGQPLHGKMKIFFHSPDTFIKNWNLAWAKPA
jgi:hypothetical protein